MSLYKQGFQVHLFCEKKKPVGTFKYESAFILSTIINGEKQENIVVSYRTGLKDSETVIIPLSDIKKIIFPNISLPLK